MAEERRQVTRHSELAVQQTVIYEVKVKGRLDATYWAEWFDGITVAVDDGETVLRGPLPDQAALYGLLSRLRDLAVPLVSVRVLGPGEARRPSRQWKGLLSRVNWGLVLAYLLFVGGLSPLTIFFTSEGILDTALALTILFGALGGIAYIFSLWDRGRGWRYLALFGWAAALIPLMIYLIEMRWLPTALALAILFLALAGGLLYWLYWRRNRSPRTIEVPVRWEKLGMSREQAESSKPSPAEHDRSQECESDTTRMDR